MIFVSLISNAKDFTVVLDPGHGGKDTGAVGLKSCEKNINLAVALKLGRLLNENIPDCKVVFTRKDDTFISLQERANIANKAHGDIYISIHTNSLPKNAKGRNTMSGAATYTLGLHRSEENLAVAKRENSVIELEKDYSETYRGFDPNSTESYIIFEINQSQHLNQSISLASSVQKELSTIAGRSDFGVRQAGFWVLAATSMPAILVELDFICNPTVEEYLNSDLGETLLATSIMNAVISYHNKISSIRGNSSSIRKAKIVKAPEVKENNQAETTAVKPVTAQTEQPKVKPTEDDNVSNSPAEKIDYSKSLRKKSHKSTNLNGKSHKDS